MTLRLLALVFGQRLSGFDGWGADGNAPFPSWRVALLDVARDRPGDRIHGWRERLASSAVGSGPFDAAYT
jgi:hypothetical protein